MDRAAPVAQAAQAKLIVTAYREGDASSASSQREGSHRDLFGEEAARKALAKSVTGLTKQRARYIDQRLGPGDPVQALLDTVGANQASLIVVDNRGLGAAEGQLLGSVPGEVAKNAVCSVIIVQTSALDEDRFFAGGAGPAARSNGGSSRGADPAGSTPTTT